MNLGLGTVQFGIDYGVSNQAGKTSGKEVEAILRIAENNGISVLDTACSYGESESALGAALPDGHNFRIITKTPIYKKSKITGCDADELKTAFHNSLDRLRTLRLEGLLIHHADDLLVEGGELLFSAMQELKQKGFVKKVGVSVYTGEQIDRLTERYEFDLIHVPISILDQRLLDSGHIAGLKEKGIEIHARSVFLQGLLLMDIESLHSFFDPIKSLLFRYRDYLRSHGLTPVEGALAFVKGIPGIHSIIIGVNNQKQLKEVSMYYRKPHNGSFSKDMRAFSLHNAEYVNPSLWRLN